MEGKKLFSVLVVLLALFGMGLLTDGITGFVVSDQYVKKLCSFNTECDAPEVCCIFYEEQRGTCNKIEMCDDILELTRKDKKDIPLIYIENVKKNKSYNDNLASVAKVFLGVVLLAMIIYSVNYRTNVTLPAKPRKNTGKKRSSKKQ